MINDDDHVHGDDDEMELFKDNNGDKSNHNNNCHKDDKDDYNDNSHITIIIL